MKILHVARRLEMAGVPRVCIKETRELRGMGHDSKVLWLTHRAVNNKFTEGLINYFYNGLRESVPEWLLWASLLINASIALKTPSHFSPDWVVCHHFIASKYCYNLAKKYRAQFAFYIHVLPPTTPRIPSWMDRKLYNESSYALKADLLLANSKRVATFYKEKTGMEPKILYPATDSLSETDIPKERGDYLLCATRLSAGKEIELVAEAISKSDKNTKVVFAGSTHKSTQVILRSKLIKQLQNSKFVLNPSDSKLRDLYKFCRAYVLCHSEPFGMPQLESAGCGSSMMCHGLSGASELFVDKVHGYFPMNLQDGELVSRFAEHITDLMDDERKAWKMGFEAWKLCKEKYTWRRHCENLLHYLSS